LKILERLVCNAINYLDAIISKSPGLSWDVMLKMTDIKLELMLAIDMNQFIEKSMRGGISYIANRYRKTNNKYMKTYDKKASLKYSWLALSHTKLKTIR